MVLEIQEKEKEMLKRVLESFENELKTVRFKTDRKESRLALKEEEDTVKKILERIVESDEALMDVRDYCNNVSLELSGWKAKFVEVVSKLDRLVGQERAKIQSEMEAVQNVIEELDNRLEELKLECADSWKPGRERIRGEEQKESRVVAV